MADEPTTAPETMSRRRAEFERLGEMLRTLKRLDLFDGETQLLGEGRTPTARRLLEYLANRSDAREYAERFLSAHETWWAVTDHWRRAIEAGTDTQAMRTAGAHLEQQMTTAREALRAQTSASRRGIAG